MRSSTPKKVYAYIAAAPPPARTLMLELRRIVRAIVPGAEETIRYRMPMHKHHGMLVGSPRSSTTSGFTRSVWASAATPLD